MNIACCVNFGILVYEGVPPSSVSVYVTCSNVTKFLYSGTIYCCVNQYELYLLEPFHCAWSQFWVILGIIKDKEFFHPGAFPDLGRRTEAVFAIGEAEAD